MGYLPSPPAQPIATKIGMGCPVAEVINHAKFQLDRFRGFRAPDGPISLSPIDLRHQPYNSYALPCYTVTFQVAYISFESVYCTRPQVMPRIQRVTYIAACFVKANVPTVPKHIRPNLCHQIK